MPMKYPPHPGGSILRDCIEPLGLSVTETAQKLDVTPEELLSIINGQSGITFALAIRLDKLFGCGASTWYQLQAQYDEGQERNRYDVPEELEPLPPFPQIATRSLEHGRVVYTTYDAEVIALRIVPWDAPKLSDNSSHDRVEFQFVGEGAGAVQIQMIYQPSARATPRLVADTIFKTYLEWDAESDEYVGRIDAAEWRRESQKLYAGKETMNALYRGLPERFSVPALGAANAIESSSEHYLDVLREAEELLHKGTASISAEALAGV